MLYNLLKSKIHRATVTGGNVEYEGSLTISSDLMELAGLLPYERILCGNMAQYNSVEILPGPNLTPIVGKRAQINGLVVYDYWDQLPLYRQYAANWIADYRHFLQTNEIRNRALFVAQ